MEDLLEIYRKAETCEEDLEQMKNEYIQRLRAVLWGAQPVTATLAEPEVPIASPQQTKKRAKRLTSLQEDEEASSEGSGGSQRLVKQSTSSKQLSTAAGTSAEEEAVPPKVTPCIIKIKKTSEAPASAFAEDELMPPPPAPPLVASLSATSTTTTNEAEHTFTRPQRAAKLQSVKNLKEPKLNGKLRRPSHSETAKIKLESEQRASQMHELSDVQTRASSKASIASTRSDDSVLLIPSKAPSIVDLQSEDERQSLMQAEKNKEKKQEENEPKKSLEGSGVRKLRIKVKREKLSISDDKLNRLSKEVAAKEPAVTETPAEQATDVSSTASTVISATTATAVAPGAKKAKKKKPVVVKPIKVERFSDLYNVNTTSPISSRTRKGSTGRLPEAAQEQEQHQRSGSVYEDAIDQPATASNVAASTEGATETPPTSCFKKPQEVAAVSRGINNETVVVATSASADATFCTAAGQTTFQVAPGRTTFVMENPNATVTLQQKNSGPCDATFNVPPPLGGKDSFSSKHSMETAKDTTPIQNAGDNSLITEDESFDRPLVELIAPKAPKAPKAPPNLVTKLPTPTSAKTYKMPTRTNELFNPLVQSPLKKKVEAFENAAHAASAHQTKTARPKRTKENALPTSSSTTPLIGKLQHGPALGRFLTPTQAANITPNAMAAIKKAPNSASKAMAFPTSSSASNLRSTNATLSRENSADEMRKGLQQLAEERKRQREQKHLLAAQQREAKERERNERLAKTAREREEKRLKKLQEQEQKKRELEEIHRKLRQQEEATASTEAAKLKAAKLKANVEHENELLAAMKKKQDLKGASSASSARAGRMLPPPPRVQTKYTFEMLHEDDSTDDEEKVSHKRPLPPTWSQKHMRGIAIHMQQYCPSSIIDSFFSVQPMTPDLKKIFPNIDARHLKRNSSVLWSTPPRYSELPKY